MHNVWRITLGQNKHVFKKRAYESVNCSEQNQRYNFFSTCRDSTEEKNGLMLACAKTKLFLEEKSNKCDLLIIEALKKNLAV